ncbi:hypothetical protein [Streptomyces sp. MNU89]|nr:hypothetical protein [Streptomyces sp. MNU89]
MTSVAAVPAQRSTAATATTTSISTSVPLTIRVLVLGSIPRG